MIRTVDFSTIDLFGRVSALGNHHKKYLLNIEKNFDAKEQNLIKFMYSSIIHPIWKELEGEIKKLQYQIDTINSRFPSKIKRVNNIDNILHNKIVIVDFFSKTCIPCYALESPMEKVAAELDGEAIFVKADIDKNRDLIKKYGIKTIPLVVLFKDGKELYRITGTPMKNGEVDEKKAMDYFRWMVWRASVPEEEFQKTYRMVEKIARVKGWKLNPDAGMVNGLVAALTYNRLKYGKMFCPCKPEHVKENICPCKPYGEYIGSEERIKNEGVCYCGLFVKGDKNEGDK